MFAPIGRRLPPTASTVLVVLGISLAACGDDGSTTATSGAGGSATSATGSGAGAGGAAAFGEALVALINVEDEIFEVEIEGDPFSLLPMNLGAGVVFSVPLVDCGAGVGTCVEVFREGFTDPTRLPVEDGGAVVHVFAGAAGEAGDATSSEAVPVPGFGETSVVVRTYLEGPELVLSAPTGTLNPLATGVAVVDAGQEIAFVQEDSSITLTGIVLEEGRSYAIVADVSGSLGIELAVCPLEDGADCESWAYN